MWTETIRRYRQVHIHVDRNHTWVQTGAYSCGQKPYVGTDRCIFMWIETIRWYRQVHIRVNIKDTLIETGYIRADSKYTVIETGAYSCGDTRVQTGVYMCGNNRYSDGDRCTFVWIDKIG
jgi:hypothetical protein